MPVPPMPHQGILPILPTSEFSPALPILSERAGSGATKRESKDPDDARSTNAASGNSTGSACIRISKIGSKIIAIEPPRYFSEHVHFYLDAGSAVSYIFEHVQNGAEDDQGPNHQG